MFFIYIYVLYVFLMVFGDFMAIIFYLFNLQSRLRIIQKKNFFFIKIIFLKYIVVNLSKNNKI